MRRVPLALATIVAALTLACQHGREPLHAPPGAKVARPDAALLDELSLLTTGELLGDEAKRAWLQKLTTGESVAEFIDALLAKPAFSHGLAPYLVAGLAVDLGNRTAGGMLVLKRSNDGVFFIQPCRASDAVDVEPWWAPGTAVRVCPDAYQPKQRTTAAGNACSGELSEPGGLGGGAMETCACGPNLMRCYPSEDARNKIGASAQAEVRDTIGYVVEHDLPIESVWTSNETMRNRDAEFLYQRWRVESGEIEAIPRLAEWTDEPRWAPRIESMPEEHSGILTTVNGAFTMEARPRARMKRLYLMMWCVQPFSSHVTTDAVLSVGTRHVDIGGRPQGSESTWDELAKRPFCTDCHARMDYGRQFLLGFPDGRAAQHFEKKYALGGTGEFYVNDISDLRGRGPLTPLGWAKLAVSQPEFGDCIAQRIGEEVFADSASPDDQRVLREAFDRTHTMKAVMRVALARLAGRHRAGSAPTTPTPSPEAGGTATGEAVHLPASTRRLVEARCLACHGAGSSTLDLSGERLSRATVTKMLLKVATGEMPKTRFGMAREDRDAFTSSLIAILWPSDPARTEATKYFTGARTFATHEASRVNQILAARSGATSGEGLIAQHPLAADRELSPDLVTSVALRALELCKGRGLTGADLDACLRRTTSLEGIVRRLDAAKP
jgi:hypothetical protein